MDPAPGSKRDDYRLTPDAWFEAAASHQRQDVDLAQLARTRAAVVPAGGRAGSQQGQFYAFLATELPALVQRWRARGSKYFSRPRRASAPEPSA